MSGSMVYGSRLARGLALLAVTALAGLASTTAAAAAHEAFATSDAAVAALVSATKVGDIERLKALFGPGAEDLVDSGDPVQDARDRKAFVSLYKTRHRLVADGADRRLLIVGQKDFTLPTPLVHTAEGWRFDGAAGAQEVIYERIGRNELDAIAVLNGAVEAQLEYRRLNPEHRTPSVYASHLVSEPGRRNGLYWPTGAKEKPSPAGALVAAAADEGYDSIAKVPYRGYYFHLLKGQGPAAAGGAKSYEVDGGLAAGFAFVAWPAQYRASGVMTFIVNQEGVIYQKDLGDDTEATVKAMQAFDPGAGWVALDTP